jgi:hypothetical protein
MSAGATRSASSERLPPLEAAVEWLLTSPEPAIRFLARRDLLDDSAEPDAEAILAGTWVSGLVAGRQPDGGFGGHPYKKWTGAHWRLVSLVELAAPAGERRLLAAAETVLAWLTSAEHRRNVRIVRGLARAHASMEGNALAVCSRIGLAGDPRVEQLARSLVEWQWPDGGWNCDRRATGRRSSFHESLPPAWGLHEYARATGAAWAEEAAQRAAELFLEHRVFRALATGEPISEAWLRLRWPPYWHYDVLRALVVLGRLGRLDDPRAADAVDLVAERRRADGLWHPDGAWWRGVGSAAYPEAVDWGRRGPSAPLTLDALRVLRGAGRLA